MYSSVHYTLSAKTINQHNLWSQQQHWNVAVLFVVIRNSCCYALDFWQLHGKTNKHKQILHSRINFVMFCTNCASGETVVEFQQFSCIAFSKYIPSLFHNLIKALLRETLWTGHLWTVQYKAVNSQQFILTPHTEHQCVPFCDYSQVQAKYRLNIALHFNPQPTSFIVTKYRHTIQLHILSVDTAI